MRCEFHTGFAILSAKVLKKRSAFHSFATVRASEDSRAIFVVNARMQRLINVGIGQVVGQSWAVPAFVTVPATDLALPDFIE